MQVVIWVLAGKSQGSSEVKALQDKYFKLNSRLSELQNQQRDLEAKLKHDYGPDGVFGALVDKCFETKVSLHTEPGLSKRQVFGVHCSCPVCLASLPPAKILVSPCTFRTATRLS